MSKRESFYQTAEAVQIHVFTIIFKTESSNARTFCETI